MGAWLLLQLNEKCTLSDLLKKVAETRNEDDFVKFRKWWTNLEDAHDIVLLLNKIRKKFSLPRSGEKLFSTWTLIPPWFSLKVEKDLTFPYGTASIGQLLRQSYRNKPATLLTSILSDLVDGDLRTSLQGRVRSILENHSRK